LEGQLRRIGTKKKRTANDAHTKNIEKIVKLTRFDEGMTKQRKKSSHGNFFSP